MTSAIDIVICGLIKVARRGEIMHGPRRIKLAQDAYDILKKELNLEDGLCVCGDLTRGTDALGALRLLAKRSAERRNNGNYLTLREQLELHRRVAVAYAGAQEYVK